MSMRLFEHPLSPFARKVKIVLYEKGLPFERVHITPMTAREGDPDFAEFAADNRRLEVPCLFDEGFRCVDSTVIVDYLDEKWPDPAMLPRDPRERARARLVEELCDTALDAINWGLMEIRFFRRAEGDQAKAMMVRAGEQLAGAWDHLESELGDRPFFGSDAFGRADASLIVHVAAAALFGFPLLDRHPGLRAWSARCMARESVQRDQGEVSVFMSGDGPRSMRGVPGSQRQYRDHRLEWMMKSGGVDIVLRGIERGTLHFVAWP
jgi:glutathione S-transferase/RNA polymerase-associated protein